MIAFENFLSPDSKCHLVGIGGVSMSSLAEVLKGMRLTVSGSDTMEGPNVRMLKSKGIPIVIGHKAENIHDDLDFIVRTAAVHDDNPEIIAARAKGIPVFERAQAWGAISKDYANAVCISGTHGKTTTTSMCTHILMAAEKDPTVMIGGTLPLLNAGHRVGHGNTIIMEACEYYDSFLSLHPTVAVVLNIEEDHLDYFSGLPAIEYSFRSFCERTPETGTVVANYDDTNTMDALEGICRDVLSFGLSPEADLHAVNIRYTRSKTVFDIVYEGERLVSDVTIYVPGEHNVRNALAAAAASISLGIRPSAIKYGLSGYSGVGRRFEFKGLYNGVEVYDDYAHHPSELRALLNAVDRLGYKRTVLVFQPHTYSRTIALFDKFVEQLKRPDVLLLAEIYAAREQNIYNISSADLAAQLPNATFFPDFKTIDYSLRALARPGDIILTVGAGDVFLVGENLLK